MRALTAVLLLLLAAPALAQTTGSELPDIGNPANTTLSLEDEYKIGLMILRQLRESGQVVEDPEINEYLQGLGMRLSSQAHEGAHRFTFFAVRDSSINAFALPGGFIGVNAGLVKATRSEAELAGVIAHEIAHVTQRHIARSVQNAGRANMASMAGMLAAILIGATTGLPSDAVLGGVTAAQGLAAQNQINFTRANEAEADRVGIGILAAAGFDPVGMPEFFNTMQQRTGGGGRNIPEMLLSHPVTSERIAETRDRASKMARPRTPDSTSYALIRDRLELETLSPETQAATSSRTRRARTTPPRTTSSTGAPSSSSARGPPATRSRCCSRCATAARTSCSTTRRSARRSSRRASWTSRARRSRTRCGSFRATSR